MWNEGSRSLHWPKLEMFRAIKANPIKHMNHCKPHVHLSRLQTWSCGIITWKLQALNAWLLAAHCNAYGGMSCGIITWKRQALNARLLAAHCTAYGGMSCGIITWKLQALNAWLLAPIYAAYGRMSCHQILKLGL